MSSSLPNYMLDELAFPLKGVGGDLPVTYLRRWLGGEALPNRLSINLKRAVLLCAFNYQFATCVVEDCEGKLAMPTPHRWRRNTKTTRVKVPFYKLTWIDAPLSMLQPLPRTRIYLEELPETMVSAICEWAPPVVIKTKKDNYRLVANHVSAMLAKQRGEVTNIPVRVLPSKTALSRHFPEICLAIVKTHEPIFTHYRSRIPGLASSLAQAMALSGYGRSRAAELRRMP